MNVSAGTKPPPKKAKLNELQLGASSSTEGPNLTQEKVDINRVKKIDASKFFVTHVPVSILLFKKIVKIDKQNFRKRRKNF